MVDTTTGTLHSDKREYWIIVTSTKFMKNKWYHSTEKRILTEPPKISSRMVATALTHPISFSNLNLNSSIN